MIESECFNKFKKLIWDGPKYLFPLIDWIETSSFSTFFSEPEKLFHVAFSSNSFFTVDLDRHVKLPNLIDFPVNAKVRNLWNRGHHP